MTSDSAIRVLVADNFDRFRDGLARHLARDPRFEVVGTAGCGESAATAVSEHRPDVAILDLDLPTHDALEVFERVGAIDPALGSAVMVVAAVPDVPRARETEAAIGGSVLNKARPRVELADAAAAHATAR